MFYFSELFPKEAQQETVLYHAPEDTLLPAGDYAFIESFCGNPECDCKKVTIQIEFQDIARIEDNSPPTAVLVYEFNTSLSDVNPSLHPRLPMSPLANAAMSVFAEYVQSHPEYVEKLSEHYFMVKKACEDFSYDDYSFFEPSSPIRREQRVGRNELCPCGSGKKFKKCCQNS